MLLSLSSLVGRTDKTYDFFLASLGFERRARHIGEEICPNAPRRLAIGFRDRQVFDYEENRKWFGQNGYEIVDNASDEQFAAYVRNLLLEICATKKAISGCVDISSLNRNRLATLIELFADDDGQFGPCSIDFYYSLGSYSSPPTEAAPNTHLGPVTPYFAGWTNDPNRPPVAIVGLGYEQGKALGAVEFIQADEAWLFVPKSPVEEYFDAVLNANARLLEGVPDQEVIAYRVEDPVASYFQLEALVYAVMRRARPVLLPFGPKIFSLIALLVATRYREVSVWRVSAQQNEEPSNRLPSECVIGLSARFGSEVSPIPSS